MIVSRQLGFAFIKARKVGGTSVEMALSTLCRHADDIVTPITPVDERARLAMGGRPRNFAKRPECEDAYIRDIAAAAPDALADVRARRVRFRNHMTLRELEDEVDLAGLRVLAVVRSPYGRIVSAANHRLGFEHYQRAGAPMKASPEEIRREIDQRFAAEKWGKKTLSDFYRGRDGQVRVEVLHQETLDADFARFVATLAGAPTAELPRAKAGLGLSAHEAAELLRPDQRRRIAEVYAEDIALFGDGL